MSSMLVSDLVGNVEKLWEEMEVFAAISYSSYKEKKEKLDQCLRLFWEPKTRNP